MQSADFGDAPSRERWQHADAVVRERVSIASEHECDRIGCCRFAARLAEAFVSETGRAAPLARRPPPSRPPARHRALPLDEDCGPSEEPASDGPKMPIAPLSA